MHQGLPQVESHPHALHAQKMVVASPGRTRTLRHPPGINSVDYNDDKQHHDLRLHLCQAQAQEYPRHFLPNFTHQPTNCMDTLNIILDFCLRGRDRSLLRSILPKAFTVTNNQESPTIFYASTRYTLWDSGCTHSINHYFDIYTEYKTLGKEGYIEINGIGGLINPKGVGTFFLYLEDYTGQIHNLNFKQVYYLPGAPKILSSPQKCAQDRV